MRVAKYFSFGTLINMVKIPAHKVDEELEEQEEIFGEPDEAKIGKDVDEDLARVIGNEPTGTLAEEVDDDEEAILHDKPEDESSEDVSDQ